MTLPGVTMRKLTSRAFQKCGTFPSLEILNRSYGCSKSGQISRFFSTEWRCPKKKTRLQYCTEGRHMNRIGFSHGKFDILFISGLKTAYWSRVFFCDVAYFRGRVQNFRLCWLWAAETPVQKLEKSISSTFLKPPGRQLSHGATHIGSTASEWPVIVGNTKKYIFCVFRCPLYQKMYDDVKSNILDASIAPNS